MLHSLVPQQLAEVLHMESDKAKLLLGILAPATAAATGIYLLYRWWQGRDLPPGPAGLPILGRLPWIDPKNLHLIMQKVAQNYGDLSSFYIGGRLFIVLNSYQLIKEMMDIPVFAGRPRFRLVQKLTRGCGIIFTEGEVWSHHRRMSLKTLRDFGFARTHTVEMVDEQLDAIFQTFDAEVSKPVEVLDTFLLASNSVITEMTLGHRFERNDPQFHRINTLVRYLLESGVTQTISFLFPAIEGIIEMIPTSSAVASKVEQLHEFIRGEIRQREKVMVDEASEPECLCDFYIQEKRKAEASGDFETFKEFQLIRVCLEFYLAGTDTTARSLEWLLIYMAFNPEVQGRVQKELDDVVGQSRRAKLQDKVSLHYTSAVIDEGYRAASLASTGVFHRAMEDTSFHGYRIPSNAIIIPLLHGVHRRADYWEKPDEFYPEHFLDAQGHYKVNPHLIPFMVGKRACVGESLARMEVFLFFTAIMQRYRVKMTEESLARKDEIISGYLGTLKFPGKYQMLISRR